VSSKRNNKLIFLHSGRGWVCVRGEYIYPHYPCFEIEDNPNPYTNSVKRGKPVNLGLVRAVIHGYGLCCHVYSYANLVEFIKNLTNKKIIY